MPTYTYSCNKCGVQEIYQSITENNLTKCPICDSIHFNKIYNAVGVQFKGKGFYSTDSRKKQGMDKKEIQYEIITALEKLEEIYNHIDNAMSLAVSDSFLQDTLHVASRNLGTTRMKLQVAQDIAETI